MAGSPPAGAPGRWVWSQLLRDVGAPAAVSEALLSDAGPADLDAAARFLADSGPRLIVIDDVDHGGWDAVELLALLAGRLVMSSTSVLATSSQQLGVGQEERLMPLSEAELSEAVGAEPQAGRALWLASAGLPGAAFAMVPQLAPVPAG